MRKYITYAITAIALLLPEAVLAELYKWKDDKGIPHMTDQLHKVPKEYQDQVEIKEEGDLSNISISNDLKTFPAESSDPPLMPKVNSDEKGPFYDGLSLDWWLKTKKTLEGRVETIKQSIESKELVLDSHDASLDYSSDLNKQIRDLNDRLKDAQNFQAESSEQEAQKRKNIANIKKELKRAKARRNANVPKQSTKDAVESTEEDIKKLKEDLAKKEKDLADFKLKARRAGVPQKYFLMDSRP